MSDRIENKSVTVGNVTLAFENAMNDGKWIELADELVRNRVPMEQSDWDVIAQHINDSHQFRHPIRLEKYQNRVRVVINLPRT